jgi:2-methylcitrate dehydratase
VEITLTNGKKLVCEKEDYPGFFTQPFTWEQTIEKFKKLTGSVIDDKHKTAIIDVIKNIEEADMQQLLDLICVQ